MNLDELRSVQAKERRKDSLQHLRDAFYDDVAAYVADLRAARDRRADQVANPFSDDDVRRMSDELETAEEVAEALYERRVGKVVKLASFAAADMPVETEGMTTQERSLFDDLVERIETNKSTVLDVLAGEGSATDTPPTDPSPVDTSSTDSSPTDGRSETAKAETATTSLPDSATDHEPGSGVNVGSPPDPTEPTPTDATTESNVLAGAMGGEPDDQETPDDRPADPGPQNVDDDAEALDSTDVDPEPAPPGAPGVTESAEPSGKTIEPSGRTTDSSGDGPEPATATSAATNGTGAENRRDDPSTEPASDRETVRITRDVGAILGVDEREYELAREDVVTLPAANAEPLVQRDAAERID